MGICGGLSAFGMNLMVAFFNIVRKWPTERQAADGLHFSIIVIEMRDVPGSLFFIKCVSFRFSLCYFRV